MQFDEERIEKWREKDGEERVSEGGSDILEGGKGDSTMEDVSEMQRPSASFDFVHFDDALSGTNGILL